MTRIDITSRRECLIPLSGYNTNLGRFINPLKTPIKNKSRDKSIKGWV
jgi:hypothetical protein